ncbi:MAG: alpha-isopropylmalate synthase regulatory domain-containing protein, partial [Candidatus Binatia bacterium]
VISVHCHNDLGLAVANSLAGVRSGARQVECTINGIGERAGNASLEEVVMNLKVRNDFYGIDTGIDTREIYRASRLLTQVTGARVQANKAVVGRNAFAHEAGIHQDGMLKDRRTYEIMRPESVGRVSNRIVLGKHSGRHAFVDRLRDLGIDLEHIDVNEAFDLFKRLADKKKEVYDADLFAIVAKEWDSATHFELVDVHCDSSLAGPPRARVRVRVGGEERTAEASGDGVVDACYRAIKEATGLGPRLESYQVKGITGGTDAVGEVTCMISHEESSVRGHGAHTDIIMASAYAFVDALNRAVERSRAGKDGGRPSGP